MKTQSISFLILTLLATASLSIAQEIAPLEEAQRAARKVNAALPVVAGAAIAIEPEQ
jgi:hypothetical protein